MVPTVYPSLNHKNLVLVVEDPLSFFKSYALGSYSKYYLVLGSNFYRYILSTEYKHDVNTRMVRVGWYEFIYIYIFQSLVFHAYKN